MTRKQFIEAVEQGLRLEHGDWISFLLDTIFVLPYEVARKCHFHQLRWIATDHFELKVTVR